MNTGHSKQDIFKQCWNNVGPPSATLAQHQTNIAYWDAVIGLEYVSLPNNTT